MILSCFRCRDDSRRGAKYQDKLYGKGRRVHNPTQKRVGNQRYYRCSICENERTAGERR